MHNLYAEIAKKLLADGVVNSVIAAEASIADFFKDEICVRWNIEDAALAANNAGRVLTRDQARDLLGTALAQHDASRGINWDTLQSLGHDFGRAMTEAEHAAFGESMQTIYGD